MVHKTPWEFQPLETFWNWMGYTFSVLFFGACLVVLFTGCNAETRAVGQAKAKYHCGFVKLEGQSGLYHKLTTHEKAPHRNNDH